MREQKKNSRKILIALAILFSVLFANQALAQLQPSCQNCPVGTVAINGTYECYVTANATRVMCPLVAKTVPFLWDQLIPQLFGNITGSPLITGLVIMLIFYLIGLGLRLSFEIQMIMMFFVLFTVVGVFIPSLAAIMFILVGIFVGMFLIYLLFRG
jgi:hypothetical protein